MKVAVGVYGGGMRTLPMIVAANVISHADPVWLGLNSQVRIVFKSINVEAQAILADMLFVANSKRI